jgi:hypothetical protein
MLCDREFVSREAAQGLREQSSFESASGDSHKRCVDNYAMVVQESGSLMEEETVKSRMRNLIRICGSGAEVFLVRSGSTAPLCDFATHSRRLNGRDALDELQVTSRCTKSISTNTHAYRQTRGPRHKSPEAHLTSIP